MIAQLTEETQPSFETTLKSKATSESCNVKFSCVVTGERRACSLTACVALLHVCVIHIPVRAPLFSGHPTPQVTWYKDDEQLDRYCGLPKYEIFRNGQTHSLHIYK